ncbi:MAG: glycosyltransferase family 1 protein [Candidatus Parcubacteria bacterium]|nr:glycosyltransferase family 1 protein [Candidatus Parcubacteria bacterium]
MTIGIDIRVLGSGTKSGVEEYTENLLDRLLLLDKNIKFKLFHSSLRDDLKKYKWMNLPNVEVFSFRLPNKLLFGLSRLLNRPYIDKLIGGADVFFSPHFLLASLSPDCKRVTTFHDLSYVRFKEFFSWRRNFWHKFQTQLSGRANLSDKIIAVSQSTQKDLVEKYDFPSGKIRIIYSGISDLVFRPPIEDTESFRIKNDLPDKFILFLGKLEPRKNIPGLIKAFNLLKSSTGFEDLNLVIVGSPGWLYKNIYREAKASPYKDRIIFKSYVKDEDRKFYYSLASVFVYPSFFEGFGFPPLEAMACGTPVVTSFNSSLPEVVGSGGILIDPQNAVDISTTLKSILTDSSLKNLLIKRGFHRTQNFSWETCAKETLDFLKNS